ncbi:MAG: dienelactone hydrolase family protein, partial [Erythrobacter sp.]|nr:dienelactone hydrolase family protein [Erythrobacter sp.]
EALHDEYSLPVSRIVVGGFSQGSMLATDVTLRLSGPPAGLVIYSGTLLNEAEWSSLAPERSGLSVLQSHGTEDPILPFVAAEWLRDLLTASGLDVEFQSFRGGHTITNAAIESTAAMLQAVGQTD